MYRLPITIVVVTGMQAHNSRTVIPIQHKETVKTIRKTLNDFIKKQDRLNYQDMEEQNISLSNYIELKQETIAPQYGEGSDITIVITIMTPEHYYEELLKLLEENLC